jgi:dTDP-4-amino-4,6-dideoxygalactose transaminase
MPLWGYPADNHAAEALLAKARVPPIEDACQAHGTRIRGHYAGTLTRAGCFPPMTQVARHRRRRLRAHQRRSPSPTASTTTPTSANLRGRTHGVNYKLAAPLAAIGLRRLRHLGDQLRRRRANARRLLHALTAGGRFHELQYGSDDAPNYYSLVLVGHHEPVSVAGRGFRSSDCPVGAVRPPDSQYAGYLCEVLVVLC